MAYSSKNFDLLNNRYWVILGDGECAEGNRNKQREILDIFFKAFNLQKKGRRKEKRIF
jgi:hypothetical protein